MLQKITTVLKNKYKFYIFTKKSKEELDELAIKAITSNDIEAIEYLYPAFLNPQDTFSTAFHKELTPLFLSAQKGAIKIIDYLLSLKVDLNKADANGRNALMFAILFSSAKDNNATCQHLIDCGISLSHRDLDQKPAICYIFRSKEPLSLVIHMINKGYDVTKRQIDKNSNFFDFMFSMHSSAFRNEHDKRMAPAQEICSFLISEHMMAQDCQIQYSKIRARKHYASPEIKEQLLVKIEKEYLSFSLPLVAPILQSQIKKVNKI